jgi:hypothetical protein
MIPHFTNFFHIGKNRGTFSKSGTPKIFKNVENFQIAGIGSNDIFLNSPGRDESNGEKKSKIEPLCGEHRCKIFESLEISVSGG